MLTLLSPIINALTGGLVNKLTSGIIIAVIIIAGYSFWAIHERNIGFQACKVNMLAIAEAHQNKVDETAKKVDEQVNGVSNPLDQLQQFWSQP